MIRFQFAQDGTAISIVPVLSISAMAIFFFVMGLIQLIRYRLWVYPVLGFFVGLGCILAIFFFTSPYDFYRVIYLVNLLVIILLVVVFWPVLSTQERFEANARRLFKLAAEQLEDTADGFTDRPYSAGRMNVAGRELEGFSRFLDGKHVARSFRRGNDLFLAFSMNRSVLKIEDPSATSNICITSAGEVTVSISESDYRQYRERFNFDQLCASFAGMFARFFQYYHEGREQRILSELKTAR